jgi:uncharacterized protein YxjI
MRYVMKQKLWSLGSDFVIKDQEGQPRFSVASKLLSIGRDLSFNDSAGNQLARIHQKILSIGNTYEIYHGDTLFAVVKEGWLPLLTYRFSVEVEGSGHVEIKGNFSSHEYTFTSNGQTVATVSRAWFSFTDSYGVDVAPGQDDVLILACTVVVDLCTEKNKEHHALPST